MIRIDLDDLPPRLAQQLLAAKPGEEILLVQNGAVAGRLSGAEPPAAGAPPEEPSEARAAEIFEQFRAAIEEEF